MKKRMAIENLAMVASSILACFVATNVSSQSYSIVRSFGFLPNMTGVNPASPLAQAPDGTLYGSSKGILFKISPDSTGFIVLKYFTNSLEGYGGLSSLVLDGSTLYGMTYSGGISNQGTIFKINTNGTAYTVLRHLSGSDGSSPSGSLVLSGEILYGAASQGGTLLYGTVFKLNTNGSGFAVLKNFDGYRKEGTPYSGVVLWDGIIYGMTSAGGSAGAGTVYKLNTDGSGYAVLKEFGGAHGAQPLAEPVVSGGVLYGTTRAGGSLGSGTVFKLDLSGGGFTVLHNFLPDDGLGYSPEGGLVASGSTLYGTTRFYTSSGKGTVFKLNVDGTGYAVLKSFSGADGSHPMTTMVLAAGTLFGTTYDGGSSGYGTVFKLNTNSSGYSVLLNFKLADGTGLRAGLVLSDNRLYGTTSSGGANGQGTVFSISTNGSDYTLLKEFGPAEGSYPVAGLALSGTTLYGTTEYSDAGNSGYGTIFKVNTDGSGYTKLRNLSSSDGTYPLADLVLSGGLLYGTASGGGGSGSGTVFKLNTDGTGYTVLKHLSQTNGSSPQGRLLLSGNSVYGTALSGGVSNFGTVFKLNSDGSNYVVLKNFTGSDGRNPRAGLVLSANTLYGTTYAGGPAGYGTVFSLNTNGGDYTVLKHFVGSDGASPSAPLLLSANRLFGTTSAGGSANAGTVFMLSNDGSGFVVLAHLNSGSGGSLGNLVSSGDVLYGTASSGGDFGGGIVFRLSLTPPIITIPLQSQPAAAGAAVNFIVSSLGAALTYHWYHDSNIIAGASNPVLHLANAQPPDAGSYSVVISNPFGAVTSGPVTLTITAAPPTIAVNPVDRTIVSGANADFEVSATGSLPLRFQWFFNATNALLDETNPVLHLANVQPAQAGAYSVKITNDVGAATSAPAALTVVPVGTVPVATEEALRAAIASSADPVTFACDGTILLTSSILITNNATFDGTGHQIVLSGGNAVRVFYVRTNATLNLISLTISEGRSTNGAGIFNEGGSLNVTNCRFAGNVAQGNIYGPALGGAIRNQGGQLNLENCFFAGNRVEGAAGYARSVPPPPHQEFDELPGQDAYGGAIFNYGNLMFPQCTFVQNSCEGGEGGFNESYPTTYGTPGISGTAGGTSYGGAIYSSGILLISQSTLASNSIVGGRGGSGGRGGDAGSLWRGGTGGNGGTGGSCSGAAVYCTGQSVIVNTTVGQNWSSGGSGGAGGVGGGAWNDFSSGGDGGNGASGGTAYGVLVGTQALLNCTVAFNSGVPGPGGSPGQPGVNSWYGHPISGRPGLPGADGTAFGGLSGATLQNTLLATNQPGGNCYGTIWDNGHNLSSDGACAFTNSGSINGADPRLAQLADNGGPTLTMALLAGSPAIDAADTAAPVIDQRSYPRSVGSAPDIGAFEFGSMMPALSIRRRGVDGVDILVRGNAGQWFCLLISSNLSTWLPMDTNKIGPSGTAIFQDSCSGSCRYYRIIR